jgi:hypothetical protein
MSPGVRKVALTAHVIASVGWLGAVAGFLALAVSALVTEDAHTARAAYLGMEMIGWFALVPLSIASLITGLVQGLGTRWGLLRHHWVVIKLAITVVATAVLLMYMQTLGHLADLAADRTSSPAELLVWASSPVLHAGAALLLLLVATVLAVFKPAGTTRYGARADRRRSPSRA